MTFGEAVHHARRRLVDAGIAPDEAARDAELLARHAAGWDRATFIAHTRDQIGDEWDRSYAALVERRATREPIAYIRGVQEFWGRDFAVSPDVLIPRPETELIVDEALDWLRTRAPHESLTIVDIGTGSGCLAITLAAECPNVRVRATDVSEAAIAIASTNAIRHGVRDRVTFSRGAYFDPLNCAIDLAVTNPPYVAERDIPDLQAEVRHFEPPGALFAGVDGLRDIRVLVAQAARRLAPAGALIMEIGAGQDEEVRRAVGETSSLSLMRIRQDLQGIPRTAVMHRV